MLSADIRFAVARTVRSELRGSDVLARYGGDESSRYCPRPTHAAPARWVSKSINAMDGE